jgi:tRNA-binding EMAP/Myf-like protein
VSLRVDFGDHERTTLVGMKQEREDPTEVEGRQALFIVNLPPRKMAGLVSEGMFFDIGFADGRCAQFQKGLCRTVRGLVRVMPRPQQPLRSSFPGWQGTV